MTASMSRKGHGDDHVLMESGHSLLKTERIDRTPCRTQATAEMTIVEYLEMFYNRQRIHGALGSRTPAKAEAAYRARASSCLPFGCRFY
jgi:transposase InsO family protein